MMHLRPGGCLAVLMAGLMAGCGYSVDQLAEDHALRKRLLAECAEQGVAAKDDETCRKALDAQAVAAGNAARDLFDFSGN